MGRPSEYDQAIADEICERLAEGESLRSICGEDGKPRLATIFRWLADERFKSFRDQYTHAREVQAETLADEIVGIADDGSNDYMAREDGSTEYNGDAVARSRLRVEARKWVASKLKPKKYGDKTLLGSDPDNPLPASVAVTFRNTDAANRD